MRALKIIWKYYLVKCHQLSDSVHSFAFLSRYSLTFISYELYIVSICLTSVITPLLVVSTFFYSFTICFTVYCSRKQSWFSSFEFFFQNLNKKFEAVPKIQTKYRMNFHKVENTPNCPDTLSSKNCCIIWI